MTGRLQVAEMNFFLVGCGVQGMDRMRSQEEARERYGVQEEEVVRKKLVKWCRHRESGRGGND